MIMGVFLVLCSCLAAGISYYKRDEEIGVVSLLLVTIGAVWFVYG